MNVYLTGATGYVGRAMLDHLLHKGHTVRCLIRPHSKGKLVYPSACRSQVEVTEGDLSDEKKLQQGMHGMDAVIHLVGIIRQSPGRQITYENIHINGTRNMINAARQTGVRRFIHMSALGARPDAVCAYHKSKYAAEEIVRQSGISHVIFRPSVIFGPNDEFVNMLAKMVKLPVTPVIGNGQYKLQPVSLRTVCSVFEQALVDPPHSSASSHPSDTVYDVAGPTMFTYNEMLDEIGRAVGRNKVIKLHQPLWLMKPVIRTFERFPFFPVTSDQLTMLLEWNVSRDWERLYQDFAVQPITFASGISEYLR